VDDWQGWRRIKYESQLDPGFAGVVTAIPGGEKLLECIQCGTCSGTCPLSSYMDHTPRKIIAMTRAGFKDEVLHSRTIWVCASCYSCTVECPKQIPITDVMYALKREALRKGVHPKRFAAPVMAGEFVRAVEKYGRNSETWISLWLYLKTQPWKLLKFARLGPRLILKGRMGLGHESIKNKAELRALLRAVERTAPDADGVLAGRAKGAS